MLSCFLYLRKCLLYITYIYIYLISELTELLHIHIHQYRYFGYFRNGFEHGRGTLIWANGDSYTCHFKNGRPEASSLKFVHAKAKAQISELKSSLIDCQEDLSLEKDKTMQLALSLDRAQDRCQALYTLAISAGADIRELNAIRYGDGF